MREPLLRGYSANWGEFTGLSKYRQPSAEPCMFSPMALAAVKTAAPFTTALGQSVLGVS